MLKSRRGEGYIDTVIMVIGAMMLIVLALNIFSFFAIKQDLDHYAREMARAASMAGRTDDATLNIRRDELTAQTGLHPTITFTAKYFDFYDRTVQLGDTITVTLTLQTTLRGFGVFNIPLTLTARHSGLSQRYWEVWF